MRLTPFALAVAGWSGVARGAPRVAFVLPGQGGQWHGMARELMSSEPPSLRTFWLTTSSPTPRPETLAW